MNRFIFLLFVCLSVTPLLGQEGLNLTVSQPDQNTAEWELSLSLTITAETIPGFFLQIPEGIRFIPTQIESNDQSLWLLNAEQVPEQDSVVCWHETENGLIIIFRENDIGAESSVIINGTLILLKPQLLPEELFQIKTISSAGGTFSSTEQVVEAAGIPSPITK
jgi:hypothetical protein